MVLSSNLKKGLFYSTFQFVIFNATTSTHCSLPILFSSKEHRCEFTFEKMSGWLVCKCLFKLVVFLPLMTFTLTFMMLYTLFCFVCRQTWSVPTSLPFFFSRLWTFCRSFRHRLFECRLPGSSVKDWLWLVLFSCSLACSVLPIGSFVHSSHLSRLLIGFSSQSIFVSSFIRWR